MRPIVVLAMVALVMVAGLAGYVVGFGTGRASTRVTGTSSSTSVVTSTSYSSSNSTASSATVILPEGATFQVQSSYDCLASHFAVPFNVTAAGATLQGRINASEPGVSVYLATAQQAQTTFQGHPEAYLFASSPSNSTGFLMGISPGAQSYVLWIEGTDMGCGASVVTPLEQMTTVTVPEAVTLTPGMPSVGDVGPGQP
jgi:hypothetical protein